MQNLKTRTDKILGLDPGFGRCGWGVIQEGTKGWVVSYGCIETPKTDAKEKRLATVYEEVSAIIRKHAPALIAIEELFFSKNVKTAIAVAEARGVLLLAAALHHLPVLSLTPPEVKQSMTGYGNAEKKQVQKMVQTILKLKESITSDDAADALAIALAALQRHSFHSKFPIHNS